MTPAPLALVGGDEWRPGCEPFDRRLLELSGQTTVWVLPTAAAAEGNPAGSVQWAARWFAGLGGTVEGVMVVDRDSASAPALAGQIRTARLLYISGGDPRYLLECLRGSPAWDAVLEARREGAVLAGSSAGAMVLGPKALGAVDLEVLPHHESHRRQPPAGPAIGVDGRTAALWDGEAWTFLGAGEVTPYNLETIPPPRI